MAQSLNGGLNTSTLIAIYGQLPGKHLIAFKVFGVDKLKFPLGNTRLK